MSQSTTPIISPAQIAQVLLRYRWRWIVPTIVIAATALGYACLRKADWEASQALMVRDEAGSNMVRPGRFDESDSMKTAQETVLELVKSHAVVRAALVELGPPAGKESIYWPTELDIEKTQAAIQVKAPHGAEFGSTEVFYLKVKNTDSQRTVALTSALCKQLEARMLSLRNQKADSLVEELSKTAALAQADLNEATGRLAAVEQEVGSDLAELRILNESSTGQSNLRANLIAIKNELRQAKDGHRSKQHLLVSLQIAQTDTAQLIAMPNVLLHSQPALSQLKTGLIAAQLKTATLLGDMSTKHPKVIAAQASQEQIRKSLFRELETAIRTIRIELQISHARIASLGLQEGEIQNRMNHLAGLRAGYANLVAEVQHRGETLNGAQQDLAAAQASQAAAQSVSFISQLDGPVLGSQPTGPRKALIVAIGLIGGLATGLGVVYLTVPQSVFINQVAAAAPVVNNPLVGKENPLERKGNPLERKGNRVPSHRLTLKQALVRLTQPAAAWN